MTSAAPTFPLTTVERRFWLLHHLHPDAPIANIGRIVELKGALNGDALARAFAVVARHPMLRLRLREVHGEPVAFLGPAPVLELVTADAHDDDLERAIAEIVKAPYDLRDAPLCRARLLRRGDDDHVLVIGAHHLILDGWGLSRSLPGAWCAALRGAPVSIIDDQTFLAARMSAPHDVEATEPDADSAHERDRSWWRSRLVGFSPVALPFVSSPPPRASGRAFDVEVPIDLGLFARANAFAASSGARPVHVFLAAFAVELSRAARTRDLLIGTTAASRPTTTTDDSGLGCFVRTKALRLGFAQDATFSDVVAAARGAVRESLEHAAFDAEELHTLSAPPLAALFNYIPFSAFDGTIDGVTIKGGRIIAGGTAFPISLTVDEKGPAPRLVIEVDADVFDEGFAARFADRVLTVLNDGVAHPDRVHTALRRLGAVDIAAVERNAPTAAELAHIEGGHLGRAVAKDLSAGSGPALVFVPDPLHVSRDVVVDRPTLHRRSLAIARTLRAEGVGPGTFVAVQCEHPLRTVEAIFGVLLAGAAYVPIDPAAPPLRREAILAQAGTSIVLDDDSTMVRGAHADDRDSDDDSTDADSAVPGDDSDPAYAIFTSGSTGAPKGVVISHRAVMSQLQARAALGFPRVERSMLLAPFFFDGSIETLFWSFTTGGTMHVLDEQGRRDPATIRRGLSRRAITYTSAVPALWGAMLDAFPPAAEPLDALGFVIVGGEKLTTQLIEKHRAHTEAWLVNEYGPTESTVFSSAWSAPRRGEPLGERVPIGRSAPHVWCSVVDDDLQPVPALEPGELIVSGPGLADGYLRAPELTAKAFVSRDRDDGTTERVYRTGDIVRLWPDGELEWLARRDEQVKLRGLRVEPGEVEAAILAAGDDAGTAITDCAVIVDGQHLVGYVSPASVDEGRLIAALQLRLPEAMVPARIIALAALPKTANDKIDKKALPRVPVDDVVVVAETATEQRVAATWAKVLGLEQVSVTKSFFALGGHSLKAAVVVRALSEDFGVEVTLSSLMVARTVRELARRIDALLGTGATAATASAPTATSPAGTTRGHDDASLLLPLTGRDGKPDVVFLPGIGGHVFTFAPIAEQMTHLGVGLRTHGSEAGEEPHETIEALAAWNLKVLDRLGVRDDVVFAGYSFGGLVAYEMALQRCAAGRPPRQLVIFDTMAPGYPKKLPPWTRARIHVETIAARDWSGRMAYVKDRVASVKEKFNLRMARADAFTDAFAMDAEQIAAMSPVQRQRIERLAGVSTVAQHRYWPRASLSVPLLLFAAEKGFDWVATKMDDPLMGWRTWMNGPITRVEVKGDHVQLFQAGNLAVAARAIDVIC